MDHQESNRPALIIRADASTKVGTGHVMRMLALAQAWHRRGGQAHLLGHDLPKALLERLQTEPFCIHELPKGVHDANGLSLEDDAHATIDLASRLQSQWIVADGYHFEAPFQIAVRQAGFRLAMVTDFDYCSPWTCDLIVNQNPHSVREAYANTIEYCDRLLGTRYALMRSEFQEVRLDQASDFGTQPETHRLLITLGGSDPSNVTSVILEKLSGFAHQALEVRVLVGGSNPHIEVLRKQAESSTDQITLIHNATDMPAQYEWADAIVSAGGSSCWEWMYFGLPAAIVVIADNQQPIYDELTRAGAAVGLGVVNHSDPNARLDHVAFAQFISQIGTTKQSSDRFRDQVDGYGADRLAAKLDRGLPSSGVWLRRAVSKDKKLYFDWANDPAVRAHSLQSAEIPWSEHCDWFARQGSRSDVHMLVAMRDERAIGQIRFTLQDTGGWEVAFSIDQSSRGQGIGSALLQLGIAWMNHHGHGRFTATVKPDNPASAKCFQRLGWTPSTDQRTNLLTFQLNT